jgi:hypothetical protein
MKKIGVSLLAVSLAVFIAIPALAEVAPYASMRQLTGAYTVDYAASGVDDDTDVYWELSNISRFGAKFKTGDISGHVEFGLTGAESGNNTYDRLLYGTWDFGAGSLMIGQNYPPYTMVSAQIAPRVDLGGSPGNYNAENGFVGYGALWEARKTQARLTLVNGFYVALLAPESGVPDAAVAGGDVDTTMPKLCVGYDYKTEGLSLNGGVAYNTYNYEVGTFDETVDSYLIYVNGKMPLGMVNLQASIHYGQNLTDFGLWNREDAAQATVVGNDVEDSTCYGGYVQVAIPVDPAKISLGYGYTQSDRDLAAPNDDAEGQQSYFVNAKIPIADTFFIVPEFTYYDQMDDDAGQEEDDAWFLGLLWRMDF